MLAPIAFGLEVSHAPAPYIFFAAALSIVPIAALLVHATEQIATRTGDAIGGLLNATFGNAPELIIAIVALKAGLMQMVLASIIGAVLANLLLALGLAFLLGGMKTHTQVYNADAARVRVIAASTTGTSAGGAPPGFFPTSRWRSRGPRRRAEAEQHGKHGPLAAGGKMPGELVARG